jgi:IS4 transposase
VHIDLTGSEGGETFRRYTHLGPGVLVLGDQCYGRGPGILPLLESKASVLVRFNFYSIRLLDLSGVKITPEEAQSRLPEVGTVEFEALLPGWDKPVRIFGALNPKGEGVWLLSDLSRDLLDVGEVRDLYSKRWQIELFFKRLKSILDLDMLPTCNGPTTRVWVWLKVLLAALAMALEFADPSERQAVPEQRVQVKAKRGRPKKNQTSAKSPNPDHP